MNDTVVNIFVVTILWLFMIGAIFWPHINSRLDASHPDVKDRADLLKIPPEKRKSYRKVAKSGIVISIILATCFYAFALFLIIAQHQQVVSGG
ncbi:MAG: hypothetical protein NUV75_00185 [Gallionella sp.]|nr:hypothetical protein [Gallionella sp.]